MDILNLIGPEAVTNFLQNWPFAAILVWAYWSLLRDLRDCHNRMADLLVAALKQDEQK